jgi:nicotinamidase-related amidase
MEESLLIRAEESVLVVIDIQERLLPLIFEAERVVTNTVKLIRGAKEVGVPIILTEQYPKGLGKTVEEVRDVIEVARAASVPVYTLEKTAFSCMAEPYFAKILRETGRKEAILCGIEAHVCVLQTALDLLSEGIKTSVVVDAVSSREQDNSVFALERMMQNGVTLTVMESVLYELVRDSTHPAFKVISNLVK